MNKKRILTIGPVTKDTIITPSLKYKQIGGSVYYHACTLYQLKVPSTAIITIGQNDLEMIEAFPKKYEIKIIKTSNTTKYINIYNKKLERKQKAELVNHPITPDEIQKLKINFKMYDTAILSPLSSYDIPPETIEFLKKEGMNITLLPQGYLRHIDKNKNVISNSWQNTEEYLKYTDTICLDINEMKTAFQINSINKDTIHKIQEKYENINEIIITEAEKGSTIYTKDRIIKINAIKTNKPIDPTGLGDTYIAAYTSKKIETNDLYLSGVYASLVAKNKLETKGPIKTTDHKINQEFEKIVKKMGEK